MSKIILRSFCYFCDCGEKPYKEACTPYNCKWERECKNEEYKNKHIIPIDGSYQPTCEHLFVNEKEIISIDEPFVYDEIEQRVLIAEKWYDFKDISYLKIDDDIKINKFHKV